MSDIFSKRMNLVMQHGSLGAKLVDDSNIIEDKMFSTDANFRTGMLYDWDMNEIEEVDFKFEKIKTYTADGIEVEYMVHFRPNFNPEYKYKELYYKKDGKERLGFYIDVLDRAKNVKEKWMIVSKDDRVAFDRYNAYKCNWCFEWVYKERYYNCIGCVIDTTTFKNSLENNLGGSSIDGELIMIVPSNLRTLTAMVGTKFMITDNNVNPQCYEVIKIKDTSPLGVTRAYLKQRLFNPHTDVCGNINELSGYKLCFELPLDDLPEEYGGKHHMICNCLKSKGLPEINPPTDVQWKLNCDNRYIYVNGQIVLVEAIPSNDVTDNCDWHIFIDDIEYSVDDLKGYFDIEINDRTMKIKAISKNMINYVVKIAIYDNEQSYYDSVEMEVVL